MADEKDFLEILGDDLEASDPTYAIDRQKEHAVAELIRALGKKLKELAEILAPLSGTR